MKAYKKARLAAGFVVPLSPLVAGAALTGLGFVDTKVTAHVVVAVQGLNGLKSAFVIHFDKSEATGATSLTVHDDTCGNHFTELGKERMKVFVRSAPGQVADINVLRQGNNSKRKKRE